jgi:fructose-1,6-bisphosphatase II / sedoheptulose-1,7-bisphosphatase
MIDKWLFDLLKTTESTAVACYDWIGKGDNVGADRAAVDVMRLELNKIAIDGTIIIGEGERDEAPMLYIGEKVGIGKEAIDIAVDPLEGTSICARADCGAMAVMAFSSKGSFLNAPDLYMEKIAIGPKFPKDIVHIDNSIKENLLNLASYKKCPIEELTIMVLDRERHQNMIDEARSLSVKIKLIGDGDISAVIAAASPDNEVDMYVGVGGAPEGVLAAAALKCIGGHMQTRLVFKNNDQILRAQKMGIHDIQRVYTVNELVRDEVIFAATGVTDGLLVNGVKKHNDKFTTETLLMSSSQKKVFKIQTIRY